MKVIDLDKNTLLNSNNLQTMILTHHYLLEPDYYNLHTRPQQHKRYQNPNVYLPQPPDPRDIEKWYGGKDRGQERELELPRHRLFGGKTRSLESRIAQRHKNNWQQRQKRSYSIHKSEAFPLYFSYDGIFLCQGHARDLTRPTDVPLSVTLAEIDQQKEIIKLGANYKMYSFMLLFIQAYS